VLVISVVERLLPLSRAVRHGIIVILIVNRLEVIFAVQEPIARTST